jgi:hypothetical protein
MKDHVKEGLEWERYRHVRWKVIAIDGKTGATTPVRPTSDDVPSRPDLDDCFAVRP